MDLLADYARKQLASVSPDRRRASVRVLSDFLARSDGPLNAQELRLFLHSLTERGYSDSTLRKSRAIVLAFASWAWREGYVSGTELLALREVRLVGRLSREVAPAPYRPGELRRLRGLLDERWPKAGPAQAEKWMRRYSEGRSPYSRIRTHVVRCQLDAVITSALHLGLRRREIYALDVVAAHPENAYVVVWDGQPGGDGHRGVPFTSPARDAMCEWISCHGVIAPQSMPLWLNTHGEPTVRQPMTRETFDRLLATYVGRGWTLKRLRDTCAVGWVRAGLPLEHVRQLLGLSSIASVLPYAKLISGSLEGRMAALDEHFSELVGPVAVNGLTG